VDHRVEPPTWLPQGAAAEAADPEADESTATEDAQQAEDSNEAPAEAAADEFSNGNGHDSSFTYSRDDSYHYGGDSPYGEGTSYRSPFTPHTPGGTSYAPEEQTPAENGLATSDVAGTEDAPDARVPGHDLPATGLSDPAMPDTGFASAAAGFQSPGTNYTDHGPGYTDHGSGSSYADTAAASHADQDSGSSYADQGSGSSYADTAAASHADQGSGSSYADQGSGSSYADQGSGSSYADTAAASYSDPAALPYPAAEPLATAGTPASEPTTAAFSGPGSTTREQRSTFAAGAAVAGGIGAALRAGKQRSTSRLSSRSQQPVRSRPGVSQARKANLVISRIEPWSVMKFSFLISLVLWIVMFVAVALLYYAMSSLGVFGALQRTLASVTSSQTSAGVDLTKWTSAPRVLGYTMLLGAVDVVLITAISTVGAVIYNLVTHLGGGIEVTLKETE
jgi:hypothetical protein